jgi:predicted nuclease of predicted toxin-antitoxin system
MRFLVDECTGPAVARWLRERGHEVFSVYEEARGLDDDEVIHRAFIEGRVLITNDKEFGEKIYREKRPHRGVVLFRLQDERNSSKIAALDRVLANYAERLTDHFVVGHSDEGPHFELVAYVTT